MKIVHSVLILMIFLVAMIALASYLFPQINFREMPEGLKNGKLDDQKPNWVSSRVAETSAHYVAPLLIDDLTQLAACLKTTSPKTTIQQVDEQSLIAYRQSPFFNFTDWIMIDKNGQVTSSATMGYYDFGKNRLWVDAIRKACVNKS